MQANLFETPVRAVEISPQKGQAALGQYFTPFWAARELVERNFPDLSADDVVIEPTAGPGAFLNAIPEHVPAFGVEIDPALARMARANTGRTIITGDVTAVGFPMQPTVAIGNPPFSLAIFEQILARLHQVLPERAQAGFICPAYFLQTPRSVMRMHEHWSIRADLLPRTLFPSLSKPLVFAMFTKEAERRLIGFALYHEVNHVEGLDQVYQDLLNRSKSGWVEAIARVMVRHGGVVSLQTLFQELASRRPTATAWWKEQIRKVVRGPHFHDHGNAMYGLMPA